MTKSESLLRYARTVQLVMQAYAIKLGELQQHQHELQLQPLQIPESTLSRLSHIIC